MRNLILFIQRFYVFFLFLIFLVFSLFVLISQNAYQRSAFLNTSNIVSGTLFSAVNDVRSYFFLARENDMLREELSELKSRMREAYYVDTVTAIHLNDTFFHQHYDYFPARVINNSITKKLNYITLNKGRIHGVEKNQGVICDQGIVGVVVNVSDRFCTVMSVLNLKSNTSPKIDSSDYFGSLKWDGGSSRYAQLTDINRFAVVKEGQKVKTSGYSLHYPEDVMIGTITKVELKEGNNFYDIEVELSTDFSRLTTVYIVKNLFKKELEQLESETREGDKDDL